MRRSVKLENIENFRDIGGYECEDGSITRYGVIYRSAKLHIGSPKDRETILSLGIKSDIDLRSEEDKRSFPDDAFFKGGLKVIEASVNGAGRIPLDRKDQIDSYLEMLEEPRTASNVFRSILNANKPLVMHCNAGKDRTGCFTMILLMAAGVHFEQINADYHLSESLLVEMGRNADPSINKEILYPDVWMLWDVRKVFLDRYGSVESYFKTIGLSEDEIKGISKLLK